MSETAKIMYDDPDAAELKTVEGWVGKDGRFWGKDNRAEHMARWSACTHMVCECGNEHDKGWTCCASCREKNRHERYLEKEYKPWGGEPLFSDSCGEYFFDEDDLEDYCNENECKAEDLDLIICDPTHMREIDEEWWHDDLPEDTYLSDVAPEIAEKIHELNKIIRADKPILSWYPGKYRTSVEIKQV